MLRQVQNVGGMLIPIRSTQRVNDGEKTIQIKFVQPVSVTARITSIRSSLKKRFTTKHTPIGDVPQANDGETIIQKNFALQAGVGTITIQKKYEPRFSAEPQESLL